MTTSHAQFLYVIRDELPILLGVLPFGMIYGVSAINAGIPAFDVNATCLGFLVALDAAVELAGQREKLRLQSLEDVDEQDRHPAAIRVCQ